MKQVKGNKHSGPDSQMKAISSVQLKRMVFRLFKLAGILALKLQVRKAQAGCLQHLKMSMHQINTEMQCRVSAV